MTQEVKHEERPGLSTVTVTIDGRTVKVHRGSHVVSELKSLLGVDPSYALELDFNGTLSPLTDDDRITIKGGEVFFSHPRTGASS